MIARTPPRYIIESLTLDVYIIGYRTQGESILIVVKSDGIVCFTCVIDCFENNNINKTIDLLNELNIKSIDLVCWTHPDEDHSIGIDTILSEYSTSKTTVLIPYGLNGNRENIEYNERISNVFKLINDNTLNSRKYTKTYRVERVSNCTNITRNVYMKGKDNYILDIFSLSPSSQLIDRRELDPPSKPNKNDYSVALCVCLGDLELFFGSDIENISINEIERYLLDYMPNSFNLLKVPHHASLSSDKMLDLLNLSNKSDIACSTVFRSNKLPEIELIELYRQYSKMFLCTGDILEENDSSDFGCINITYNILEKTSNINLCGNASVIFEDLN